MMLPDIITQYPAMRKVLDGYGLKGCGGPTGPLESVAWFARAHAPKEDDLLVPLIDSEVSLEKQGEIVGRISAYIPPEMMEGMVKWMVGIFTVEESADFLGIIQSGTPPEGFAVVMEWVRETLPARDWGELLEKMPALA
jgi:hypothetical protein